MAASFTQAQAALRQVLSGREFRTPPARQSWLVLAWRWLVHHVHLSIGSTTGRLLAWGLLGVVLVCGLLLAGYGVMMFRRRAKWGYADRAGALLPQPMESARKYLDQQSYADFMRALLEAVLQTAQQAGWVRRQPWKTLRMYTRELNQTAPAEYALLFQSLSAAGEAVLFAGHSMTRAQAEEWLQRVEIGLRKKSA